MFDHKIIITGPVGVGKSTAIRAYSTTTVVDTDVQATDETRQIKKNTTVAMDYGTIILDDETKVHLYGTPGQERFDFMWEILRSGSRGLIILLNAKAEDPAQELRFYLHAFGEIITKVPVVVGVNRAVKDEQTRTMMLGLQQVVRELGVEADVLLVDVRKRKDVNKLVKRILFSDKLFAV